MTTQLTKPNENPQRLDTTPGRREAQAGKASKPTYVIDPSLLLLERAKRGLSQRNFAALCGVCPTTMTRLEAGFATPIPRTIARIAIALDLPIETFIRLAKDAEHPAPAGSPEA